MSQQSEAGLAALQSSDFTGAIPLLEEACQIAPEDYDSHLFLGAAYGGAGRQLDAINALTKSVQIQPANGQARYNLGVAMERAGYEDQAKLAFEQALMLQPEYPQAQQALQRLTGMSSVVQAPLPQPQQAQTYQPQEPAPQYGAPPQPAPQYGSPQPSAPQYGTPQQLAPLYGAPQQAESPGYTPPGQPASSPLPAYGQLSQQPLPYGAPGPSIYPANARYYVEDAFDLKQAWKDLWMTITSPVQFFDSQIDRDGLKAPTSFILMGMIVTLVLGLTQVVSNPAILFVLPLSFPFQCLGMLIYGGIYHLIGKLFGSSSNYSASYRAATYSFGPAFVLSGISSFILGILFLTGALHVPGANPGATGASPADVTKAFSQLSGAYLVSGIFGGIGIIWAFALACIGVGRCQKTSTGAGVGTVIVSWLITTLVLVVPLAIFFVAIASALAAAGGAR